MTDKENRGRARSSITRRIKTVKRLIAEDERDALEEAVRDLKASFAEFLVKHKAVKDETEEQKDEYLDQIQDDYIKTLQEAKHFLSANENVESKKSVPDDLASVTKSIMTAMSMPKVDLMTFAGEPAEYPMFMNLFDELVHDTKIDEKAKLTRLLQCTTGEAHAAIKPCCYASDGYDRARKVLKSRFGDAHVITRRLVTNLRDGAPAKTPIELRRFADELKLCMETLEDRGTMTEVESQDFLRQVLQRLPFHSQNKWRQIAVETKTKNGSYPKYKDFADFVEATAATANDPVYGAATPAKSENKRQGMTPKATHAPARTSHAVSTADPQSNVSTCNIGGVNHSIPNCILCNSNHKLVYCPMFKSLKPDQRLDLVKSKSLCHICFIENHTTDECKKPFLCKVDGCGGRHSTYIHVDGLNHVNVHGTNVQNRNAKMPTHTHATANPACITDTTPQTDSSVNSACPQISEYVSANTALSNSRCDTAPLVPIVKLSVGGYEARALLDTGSNVSCITDKFARRLGLTGNPDSMNLSTLHGMKPTESYVINELLVHAAGSMKDTFRLNNLLAVDTVPAVNPEINLNDFTHLAGLPCCTAQCQAIDILIGQDNSDALIPLEVRRGQPGEPFAVRTLLGWTVNGPVKRLSVNQPKVMAACNLLSNDVLKRLPNASGDDDETGRQLHALWEIESEGLLSGEKAHSVEDRAVLKFWEENTKFIPSAKRYQVPIPWKEEARKSLSNNKEMALSRLEGLVKKLRKNELYCDYDSQIQQMLTKGYAEVAPPVASDVTWYLPHHLVLNEKKPGKLRVVFDCAAKYQGQSLNDTCFSGPDLNNKLLHVLLRFRQHPVAFTADVEAMYHQVLIPPDERDALRFLWFDETGAIVEYRMTRHVFGGIWCAGSATYALRKSLEKTDPDAPSDPPTHQPPNGSDAGENSPSDPPHHQSLQGDRPDASTPSDLRSNLSHVHDIINRSFYVDDCLRSEPTLSHATIAVQQTSQVLHNSGFRLTKFVSNSQALLDTIPETEKSASAKEIGSSDQVKALGISWSMRNDEFTFSFDLGETEAVTRRRMLSFVSSLYDPLGLIAPLLLPGKLLLQRATAMKMPWDDLLNPEMQAEWNQWVETLRNLEHLTIPRCFMPKNSCDVSDIQLHVFSDASESAYGCCAYLRFLSSSSDVPHVVLAFSKCKVAPLKKLSIPRLELEAALLAAKCHEVLIKQLDFAISETFFWVDSEIVLRYINNESRRFKTFIANRVSAIHQVTTPEQWNFVPSQQNAADLASRGRDISATDQSFWFKGPRFLFLSSDEWPKHDFPTSVTADMEVCSSEKTAISLAISTADQSPQLHPLDALCSHYSDWTALNRAVAWLLRFQRKWKQRHERQTRASPRKQASARLFLTRADLEAAKKEILVHAQSSCFTPEKQRLMDDAPLPKSSSVIKLDPFLSTDGLLRVGGRLQKSSVANPHPILIAHRHPIAKLIAASYHQRAHVGLEWVVSLIRDEYWITKIRSIVKSVITKCTTCKRLHARPMSQKMADLPESRIKPYDPPFTVTGVDCFGPLTVKRGRSDVKRYGCIFCCFSTRAVHLELLDSLDADSFINAFRRFVARRGQPREMWSDNGTNFVGAYNAVLSSQVDWVFQPPHSSHMGGVWERLIRTVRKVLLSIFPTGSRINDETLRTLLCEVESIVNSRPITKSSNDPNDSSALTPSHLLMLNTSFIPPAISPTDATDVFSRRWRCVQHLANEFWSKWVKMYLPELQRRQKWHSTKRNAQVGDVVLITDENSPRQSWPLGLITAVNKGSDDLVRSVTLRNRRREVIERPIHKLVLVVPENEQ